MEKRETIPTRNPGRGPALEYLRLHPGQPLQALNAGLFVSRGRGLHPDRTIDSHELILVKRGNLGLAEGTREFTLAAGDALLLWPGRRHYGTAPYPPDLTFYWIHWRMPSGKAPARAGLAVPQLGRPARPDRLTELLHQFLDDQESGALQPLQAAWLVQLMLAEAARAAAPSGAGHLLADRADAYLAAQGHRALSTSEVAEALRCNPDYLGRVYRKARGVTLTDGIHRRRVREARGLLIEGRLNVDEVARECGFDDAGYFRRIFKRLTGLTPRAFQRLHARAHINTR